MPFKKVLIGAVFILGVAVGQSSAATLDGSTVRIDFRYPDLGTFAGTSGNVVVGSGIEVSDINGYSIDISGDLITITNLFPGAAIPSAFNGFVVNDILSSIEDFTSLSFLSGSFAGIIASLDANNLYFNFSGLAPVVGASATYRVGLAAPPVPIPAALPLLASGLGALGFIGWRRKRKGKLAAA